MTEPDAIRSEEELDEVLSRPREPLLESVGRLRSPLVVLGASGKMGPSLCWLARRAAELAGRPLQVLAVSRFSDSAAREWLEARGIQTLTCDLLDRSAVQALPPTDNVIYLVGMKFGTGQNPSMTWAINTLVPAHVAEHYRHSRIVALSTGNVYPLVPISSGGATEQDQPSPIGEYGSSALARERIFEYFSRRQGTPMVILRLNYALELRYGVVLDLAQKVWAEQPVDLSMGYFNCIWQRDANEFILRALSLASTPPAVFNLTGPTRLSVREIAARLGTLLQREPRWTGREADTALLSNAGKLCSLLGSPPTQLDTVLRWTAQWVQNGGATLGKPTHFEVRTGTF